MPRLAQRQRMCRIGFNAGRGPWNRATACAPCPTCAKLAPLLQAYMTSMSAGWKLSTYSSGSTSSLHSRDTSAM